MTRNQAYSQRVQDLARENSQSRQNGGNRQSGFQLRRIDSGPTSATPVDLRVLAARPAPGAQRLGLPPGLHGLRGGFRGFPRARGSGRGGFSIGGGGGRGGGEGRGGRGRREGGRGRQPRRGGRDGGQGDEGHSFVHTQQELAYMRERDAEPADAQIEIELAKSGAKSLIGQGPAVFLGEWGKAEIVEEKLDRLAPAGQDDGGTRRQDLARQLLKGGFVRFRDESEKEAVLQLASELATKWAGEKSEQKGEVVEPMDTTFEPLDEEAKALIRDKLLKGDYVLDGEVKPSQGLLQDALKLVRKNSSYYHKEEASITRKLGSLLPVERKRPAQVAKAVV